MSGEKKRVGKEKGELKLGILKFLNIIIMLFFLNGCAGIEPPSPEYILKRPLGTDTVKIGMTKDEVRDRWGAPDQINYIEDEKRWSGKREEWVYVARYSTIPVDAGYLSKTKRLYFDGDNLTNIVEE